MTLPSKPNIETTLPVKSSARNGFHRQLEIDMQHYQALLDGHDLNSQQKTDLLEALWSVIIAFIDFGYSVHPVQRAVPDLPLGEELNREIIRTVEEFWREAA